MQFVCFGMYYLLLDQAPLWKNWHEFLLFMQNNNWTLLILGFTSSRNTGSFTNFILLLSVKSVHFKKSVTRSSFLAKSVVIFSDFVLISAKMTTLFERNENRVTGFLKWTDFRTMNYQLQSPQFEFWHTANPFPVMTTGISLCSNSTL